MSKPLLICFIGFPGSGKTTFAKQLAWKINAVVLNSDAIRIAMFGSQENVERIRQTDNSRLYGEVFGAMNYMAAQSLRAGHSVIYDAQMAKRVDRERIEKLAAEAGATPVLVWMQTSPEVAKQRGVEREIRDDSQRYDAEKMAYLVDRWFKGQTELPEDSENYVRINGELSFEEQYKVFAGYIPSLNGR